VTYLAAFLILTVSIVKGYLLVPVHTILPSPMKGSKNLLTNTVVQAQAADSHRKASNGTLHNMLATVITTARLPQIALREMIGHFVS
jgi:hypothetical protein